MVRHGGADHEGQVLDNTVDISDRLKVRSTRDRLSQDRDAMAIVAELLPGNASEGVSPQGETRPIVIYDPQAEKEFIKIRELTGEIDPQRTIAKSLRLRRQLAELILKYGGHLLAVFPDGSESSVDSLVTHSVSKARQK